MENDANLDPEIVTKIKQQEELGGIIPEKLPIGSKILVETKNSVYEIEILEDKKIKISGGTHLMEPTEGYLTGSTWGGSMLKMGWIGYDMFMEFSFENRKPLVTSRVRSAKVVGPNSEWSYELEWEKSV